MLDSRRPGLKLDTIEVISGEALLTSRIDCRNMQTRSVDARSPRSLDKHSIPQETSNVRSEGSDWLGV